MNNLKLRTLYFVTTTHIRLQDFGNFDITLLCLEILYNSNQRALGKGCGVIGMHQLQRAVIPAYSCLHGLCLKICYIVSSMCFTVLVLAGQPSFNVPTVGIGKADVSRPFI